MIKPCVTENQWVQSVHLQDGVSFQSSKNIFELATHVVKNIFSYAACQKKVCIKMKQNPAFPDWKEIWETLEE